MAGVYFILEDLGSSGKGWEVHLEGMCACSSVLGVCSSYRKASVSVMKLKEKLVTRTWP